MLCRSSRSYNEKRKGRSLTKEELIKVIQDAFLAGGEIADDAEIDSIKDSIQKILLQESTRYIGSHVSIVNKEVKDWIKSRKSEAFESYYYDRYENYLLQKYPIKIVAENDDTTDFILNNLGDPLQKNSFSTRGLVVGSVQSGKTLNFTGLINKAADHGYKFIVVMTGVHNILRSQTQKRIDQGFVGHTRLDNDLSGRNTKNVGVGANDPNESKRPYSLTSFNYDFNKMKSLNNLNLNQVRNTVVAVVKKNGSVLRNIIAWLDENHSIDLENQRRIDHPFLLIDDEADNASVNTKKSGSTTINQLIRDLLNRFNKKSYVGYTATPFANIFINPTEYDEALQADDLFPRNFITRLQFPSNYIGPEDFFGERCNTNLINTIPDGVVEFQIDKENNIFQVWNMSEELQAAIRNYILVIAARIIRGQKDSHNSMLINFHYRTELMKSMKSEVLTYLHQLKIAIKSFCSLKLEQALMSPIIKEFETTHKTEFEEKGVDISFESLLPHLLTAVDRIEVKSIHTAGDSIIYPDPEDSDDEIDYKWVIAIGGFSLGRGYTLENLSVTFLSRNTSTMDTLLQMGRWFGYRDGYEDLCRLYLNAESWINYSDTTNSLNELYDLLDLLRGQEGATPLNFGLAVREHPGALKVTAANKARNAKSVTRYVAFRGEKYQAVRLPILEKDRDSNKQAVTNLLSSLKDKTLSKSQDENSYYYEDVNISLIRKFLKSFIEPETADNKGVLLRHYLNQDVKDISDNWYVSVLSRKNLSTALSRHNLHELNKKSLEINDSLSIKPFGRSVAITANNFVPEGNHAVIGNSQINNSEDEMYHLPNSIKEQILNLQKENGLANISPRLIRSQTTKPVLIIYPLYLLDKNGLINKDQSHDYAYAIGLPPCEYEDKQKISYLENEICRKLKESNAYDPDYDNYLDNSGEE